MHGSKLPLQPEGPAGPLHLFQSTCSFQPKAKTGDLNKVGATGSEKLINRTEDTWKHVSPALKEKMFYGKNNALQ